MPPLRQELVDLRGIAGEVGRANPDVRLGHVLVDTAAMRLVASPATLDVVVTENMFSDRGDVPAALARPRGAQRASAEGGGRPPIAVSLGRTPYRRQLRADRPEESA